MTCSNILYPYRMLRKMFLVWELQTYVKYSVTIPSSWGGGVIEEKIMNINVLEITCSEFTYPLCILGVFSVGHPVGSEISLELLHNSIDQKKCKVYQHQCQHSKS